MAENAQTLYVKKSSLEEDTREKYRIITYKSIHNKMVYT